MASSLQKLLSENSTSKYFIEYNGFLTNHVAHGLVALHRLGCSTDRLNKFVQMYIARLETPPENETSKTEIENVDKLKGKRVFYYSLLKYYENIYREKYNDLEKLIAHEFPKLSVGLAGSALHGLIHLGYGYVARNERLVLEALAYLHYSSMPITCSSYGSFGQGKEDIIDILSVIAKDDFLRQAMLAGMHKPEYKWHDSEFEWKLAYLLGDQGDHLISKVLSVKLPTEVFSQDAALNVEKLARTVVKWAVTVYTLAERNNDFFLLHGVTSAWALMQIVPALYEHDAVIAIQQHLASLVAVYLVQGAPAFTVTLATERVVTEEDWMKLVDRTLGMDRDEHCYKLVQICFEMAKDDPESSSLYMQAAESVIEKQFIF